MYATDALPSGRAAGAPSDLSSAARRRGIVGATHAAWGGMTDVVLLLAAVFSIPFVILAVGIPIAGAVQLLLWAGRQLL